MNRATWVFGCISLCLMSEKELVEFIFHTCKLTEAGELEFGELDRLAKSLHLSNNVFWPAFSEQLEDIIKAHHNGDLIMTLDFFLDMHHKFPMILYPALRVQVSVGFATQVESTRSLGRTHQGRGLARGFTVLAENLRQGSRVLAPPAFEERTFVDDLMDGDTDASAICCLRNVHALILAPHAISLSALPFTVCRPPLLPDVLSPVLVRCTQELVQRRTLGLHTWGRLSNRLDRYLVKQKRLANAKPCCLWVLLGMKK